jgi:uncharacterized membrane protein
VRSLLPFDHSARPHGAFVAVAVAAGHRVVLVVMVVLSTSLLHWMTEVARRVAYRLVEVVVVVGAGSL